MVTAALPADPCSKMPGGVTASVSGAAGRSGSWSSPAAFLPNSNRPSGLPEIEGLFAERRGRVSSDDPQTVVVENHRGISLRWGAPSGNH